MFRGHFVSRFEEQFAAEQLPRRNYEAARFQPYPQQ